MRNLMWKALFLVPLAVGVCACAGLTEDGEEEEEVGSIEQLVVPSCSEMASTFSNNCSTFGGHVSECSLFEGSLECTCAGGAAEGTYTTTCSGPLNME